MSEHRFSVGQTVWLSGKFSRDRTSYTIVQLMPFDGQSYEYRIKSLVERFHRVAKEHELRDDQGRWQGTLLKVSDDRQDD
jgi:hypothetical protein